MLTLEDLMVIRAALRYFNDELVPHGPETIEDYLDEPLNENVLSNDSIAKLLDRLTKCKLRWMHYLPEAEKRFNGKLFQSTKEVDQNFRPHLATVLIPDER